MFSLTHMQAPVSDWTLNKFMPDNFCLFFFSLWPFWLHFYGPLSISFVFFHWTPLFLSWFQLIISLGRWWQPIPLHLLYTIGSLLTILGQFNQNLSRFLIKPIWFYANQLKQNLSLLHILANWKVAYMRNLCWQHPSATSCFYCISN